jgi:mono/diheme cytochrome c family protein
MNYPVWDVPSSGLFIALIAVLHVFISHFAVGGGLFLVVTERRARRQGDDALLAYVRRHSRFFVLLTLVLGAITGVAIWFTIGLVHPQGTASLIQIWVWVWAIEWTFFLTEIAAAMVYYYGWDRLTPARHLAVGWIYFWSAWLSLVAINGILTFMLTPGDWLQTRSLWSAFFNPTYWPALVARTFGAVGLAGVYALFTSAWEPDPALRARLARYAGWGWVVPMAIAVPVSIAWLLQAAAGAGVPVAALLGATRPGLGPTLAAILQGGDAGQPITRFAALITLYGALACVALTILIVRLRHRVFARPLAALTMAAALATLGGAEWVREGLRKPYVIGGYMFVNSVRLPPPDGVTWPAGTTDAFDVDALNRTGVLQAAMWTRPAPGGLEPVARASHDGHEMFRLSCASCHSVDGYNALRPLVAGRTVEAIDGVLRRLASPVDAQGQPAPWNAPGVRLTTWRGRHMPPFVGSDEERHALAVHLALLGGADPATVARPAGDSRDAGAAFFEANCAMCHGPDGEWPLAKRAARTAAEFEALLGRLPEVNEMMPPFPGNDEERRAVAEHLAALTSGRATPSPAAESPR